MSSPPPPTTAPAYKVLSFSEEIARPIDEVWAILGDYARIGEFLNVVVHADPTPIGPGRVRLVGDSILEVIVGASRYSYTYAQTRGPMAPYDYHGCIGLEPNGQSACTLTYSLVYDDASLASDQQQAQAERLKARFGGAVAAMKAAF